MSHPGTEVTIFSASRVSASVGAPNDVPFDRRAGDGVGDGRVRVAEDRGTPRLDVIDIAVPVDVEQVGALPAASRSTAPRSPT